MKNAIEKPRQTELDQLSDKIANVLAPFAHEPNDAATRERLVLELRSLLMPEVYDFFVECDDRLNPPSTVDQGKMVIDLAVNFGEGEPFYYLPVNIEVIKDE